MAHAPGARPLEGIRVLDFTRVLSGPHCTRMLSDLGAEVIKVEPPEGDLTRFAFPRVGSMSTYFAQQNIGKKNISMDLKAPEAVELVKALIRECDVVVENYRGGVMDKLGLGWSVVSHVNPRLIYAAISGYGNTGPWSHRRAYATVVNAETGMTGLQARARGGDATNDPHSHADVYTGMECAAAVLAALFQRERTGEGQYIDVSMAQTMLYVNEHVQNELFEREVPTNQIRSFQPGDYPILQTGDGTYVVVSGHPAERGTFDLFVSAMKRPELLNDPRFTDVELRLHNFDALRDIIREWALSVHTAQEIEDVMAEAGLAMGVMRTMPEIAATDWAADRNVIVNADDRSGSTFRVPNSPWVFSGSDTSTQGIPKFRGEDNEEVLTTLAGLTPEQVRDLTERGVLSIRLPRA
ncbi:MAG: CoA transferase [Ilumatobacteraceae bacterium]|jgi:CoA:oxalate CoA-transferase|nr:CoA transferase [Ilumatobacteraceae bacterium]